MASNIRRDLEQRAQRAILRNIFENYKQQHANWFKDPAIRKAVFEQTLYSPISGLLIGGTLVAAAFVALFLLPFLGLGALALAGGLAVLVFGLIIEAAFLMLSINNEQAHAKVVADMLKSRVEFNPTTIQNKNLRSKVDKSLEYWSLIEETVNRAPPGVLRDRLLQTTQEVTHWLQAVYNLANRVDKFQLNEVIRQDLRSVPLAIQNYQKKLAEEDSPEVRRQLERTIADKQRQLQMLRTLEDNMERADYQLDSTISSLGTIYSQLLLVGSKDEEGSRINRLQEEVSEQVHRLEDLTEAMDEVYQRSG